MVDPGSGEPLFLGLKKKDPIDFQPKQTHRKNPTKTRKIRIPRRVGKVLALKSPPVGGWLVFITGWCEQKPHLIANPLRVI